jgi:hypothetical protein
MIFPFFGVRHTLLKETTAPIRNYHFNKTYSPAWCDESIKKEGLTARVTGGWRDETRPRNGQNPKPRTKPKNGENPAVLVDALLGAFF